jgi:hypothetical protein
VLELGQFLDGFLNATGDFQLHFQRTGTGIGRDNDRFFAFPGP